MGRLNRNFPIRRLMQNRWCAKRSKILTRLWFSVEPHAPNFSGQLFRWPTLMLYSLTLADFCLVPSRISSILSSLNSTSRFWSHEHSAPWQRREESDWLIVWSKWKVKLRVIIVSMNIRNMTIKDFKTFANVNNKKEDNPERLREEQIVRTAASVI